ncbi:MAG: helix-turn-helix domain-containing protein [Ruminococcaceae bacterium]|nr:helix-turn-helix domain-containing protein [Oscillospiraceae bacterium]
MNYIDRIKALKSERKITNDKLSELTGIPLGTLSKLLAGMSDSPKLSNMISIANALDCSLDYLVSGAVENKNNYTLNRHEIDIIEAYRGLDAHGKEMASIVIAKEAERCKGSVSSDNTSEIAEVKTGAKILPTLTSKGVADAVKARRSVLLYNLPVSAGPGVYLDDNDAEEINIPDNEKTAMADFALRISGNSMEPKYHDGDIVLVQAATSVQIGELGIFILDGNGYFKMYGGDCLVSLNPEFKDILLRDYAENVCCGKVVGKLKKK